MARGSVRELLVKFGGQVDASVGASAEKTSREISKIGDAAEKQSSRARGAWGAIGGGAKALLGPIAAAAAAVGSVDFLSGAIDEARESWKVGQTTAQIIKQTGGAAKISADGVGKLAEEISNKTGIDDEAVQSGANMLLTFKNVRNEAGKGADIFSRATMAAQDLAAAGFGDAEGQAKMLGKALNDPIKGISALSRSGVTFTAQQKEQIKTLQASGDMLGAQKIIMKEVESQVGGVAAASATGAEKLATMWGNTKEQLGTMLLPLAERAANVMTSQVLPRVQGFFELLERNGPAISATFEPFGDALEGIGDKWQELKDGWTFGAGTEGVDVTPFTRLGEAIAEISTAWGNLKAGFLGQEVFAKPGSEAAKLAEVGGRVRLAFDQVVATAQALGAGFRENVMPAVGELGTKFAQFRDTVGPIVMQVVNFALEQFAKWGPTIRGYVTQITEIIGDLMRIAGEYIAKGTAVIRVIWDRWGAGILQVAGSVFGSLVKAIGGALNVIQGVVRGVLAILRGDWSGAWRAIQQITSGALSIITNLFKATGQILGGLARAAGGLVRDGFVWMRDKAVEQVTKLRDGVSQKMDDAKRWTLDKLGKLKSGVVELFKGIGGAVSKPFEGIQGAIASPLRTATSWLNKNILGPMNSVTSKFGVKVPQIPKFHTGGTVPGRGELLAMLLGGEGVLSHKGMRAVGGEEGLNRLNRGEPAIGGRGPVGGKVWDWLKDKGQQVKDLANRGARYVLDKIFNAASGLAGDYPPPMAGQLLKGSLMMMKDKVLSRGKQADSEAAATIPGGGAPGKVVGGRAWPTTTRQLSPSYPGHSGIDIPVPTGTPLYAAADGSISYVGWGRGYGNAIFANFQGWPAVYGHGSRPLVTAGQQVKAGQVIGLSGNTGRSTGPHLHFEIAPGGFALPGNRATTMRWLGYDGGGWLPPGVHQTYNATGKPEAILTSEQWDAVLQMITQGQSPEIHIYIDGQELRGMAREEARVEIRESRRTGALG